MTYFRNEELAEILAALEESSSPYAKTILNKETLPVLHRTADTIPENHFFDAASKGPHNVLVAYFFIRNGISYAVDYDLDEPPFVSVFKYDLPAGPYLVERTPQADTLKISE